MTAPEIQQTVQTQRRKDRRRIAYWYDRARLKNDYHFTALYRSKWKRILETERYFRTCRN